MKGFGVKVAEMVDLAQELLRSSDVPVDVAPSSKVFWFWFKGSKKSTESPSSGLQNIDVNAD